MGKIKSLFFRHVRAAILAAGIVAVIAAFIPLEEDRINVLESNQKSYRSGKTSATGGLFNSFYRIGIASAGLALIISALGPGLIKRIPALEFPYMRKSVLMDSIRLFEKTLAEINAALKRLRDGADGLCDGFEELKAEVETLKQDLDNTTIEFRMDSAISFSNEYVLNLALCGQFPDLPEEIRSGNVIETFPLENVGGAIDESDVDVVMVRDENVSASKRIKTLGKPVLVVSDSRGARMAAYRFFKNQALFYTTEDRLGEPDHIVDTVRLLDRMERATRRRDGDQRFITECPEIVGNIHLFEKNFSHALLINSILLVGETGVGKELMAKLLGDICKRPVVPVNAGKLSGDLGKAAVFGHAKGAYTDAKKDMKGALELAHHAALFLDEVADMNLALQAALLRVLQERDFSRLGDEKKRKSDFLLISATNKDLVAMVAEGLFRRDLLARLKGVQFNIPPLSKRPEDIPLLLSFFLGHMIGKTGKYVRLSKTFVKYMQMRKLPDNVRELNSILTAEFMKADDGDILRNVPPGLSDSMSLTMDERLDITR
ncbi:MAG: sigma-54-dependent Fis family transcriptional regulator, partial [Desulfobacterales bacterium]|nr:sigma-54-dependent Fis family transcriptional regulator [Desulfobacterales bacterium]